VNPETLTDVPAAGLLELIEERSTSIRSWISEGHPRGEAADQAIHELAELLDAVAELRRRGDTRTDASG
jgi:hypothetical protein